MGKKDPSRKRQPGSASACSPLLLAFAGLSLALAAALLLSAGGGPGCTDVSALNFDAAATRDDGSCVGSMYDLAGVFEVQTAAGADPNQLQAIGMEFDVNRAQQMTLITKVEPGSAPSLSGARAGDELLALRDATSTVLVSARGKTGIVDAVRNVMEARPGSTLTWVLRHAAAADGIEDIDLTFEQETIEVMPPLEAWEEAQAPRDWSDDHARQPAFPGRDDLQWCRAARQNLRRESFNGRFVLASLAAAAEGRLLRSVIGRDERGQFQVTAAVQKADGGDDVVVVNSILPPTKTACCSWGMASTYEFSPGDEVLAIDGVHIARQTQEALDYALRRAEGQARSVWVIKRRLPPGKNSGTTKSKVTKAIGIVGDDQKAQLDLSEARNALHLMRRATKHTGSVTLAEWESFGSALHQWGFRETIAVTRTEIETGEGGFRPDILAVAVPALAKALELTLVMQRAANIEALVGGSTRNRDMMEQGLNEGASALRLSLQFSKLMSSLIWLNRTSDACAIGDLAVSEAVYSRADQACGHCTRGIDTTGWVPRAAVAGYVSLLEENFPAIREEYQRAVALSMNNPHADAFFQQEKESLSQRKGDWREFELFRRGFELKHCGIFERTCEVIRQLPEASKFAGSVKFSTMVPGEPARSLITRQFRSPFTAWPTDRYCGAAALRSRKRPSALAPGD